MVDYLSFLKDDIAVRMLEAHKVHYEMEDGIKKVSIEINGNVYSFDVDIKDKPSFIEFFRKLRTHISNQYPGAPSKDLDKCNNIGKNIACIPKYIFDREYFRTLFSQGLENEKAKKRKKRLFFWLKG